jgi:hypothetical protein
MSYRIVQASSHPGRGAAASCEVGHYDSAYLALERMRERRADDWYLLAPDGRVLVCPADLLDG